MSKTVDRALEAVQKSKFNFDGPIIEVQEAFIFWTNFAGRENKFGNKARTFNLALLPEAADELNKRGWRVRDLENDEGVKLYFVNVKVNMTSQMPPLITLFTKYRGKRSRRTLDIETVGELDRTQFESADCIINSFESRQFPGKITGYLRKLNVIQEPDLEFGGKYDDWMEEEDPMDDIVD